jgi:hypothetical protein
MAIKFAAKEDAKGPVAVRSSPAEPTRPAVAVESPGSEGTAGATGETPVPSTTDADLFNAQPAPSRKRRKK